MRRRQTAESTSADTASVVLAPHISAMLADELARKSSIEQRALAIISSAGVLVSLLVALASFLLSQQEENSVGQGPRAFLAAAAVCFIVAATLALWAAA